MGKACYVTSVMHKPGSILLAMLGAGCATSRMPSASEGGAAPKQLEARPSQVSARVLVRDLRGRWQATVLSTGPVEQDEQAGYVHLQIPVGEEQPLNCFVYESPLDVGTAVYRLLESVKTGAVLSALQGPTLQLLAGAKEQAREPQLSRPLLSLAVNYQTKFPPVEKGTFFASIQPRDVFPVVCTFDGPREPELVRRSIASLVSTLTGEEAIERRLVVEEFWETTERASGDHGYSQYRVLREDNGHLTTYSRSVMFHGDAQSLKAQDALSIERGSAGQLEVGKWLVMDNGVPVFRAQVQYDAEQHSYRYGRDAGVDVSTGSFAANEPLWSSGYAIAHPQVYQQAVQLSRYVPNLSENGATVVSYEPSDDLLKVSLAPPLTTAAQPVLCLTMTKSDDAMVNGYRGAACASPEQETSRGKLLLRRWGPAAERPAVTE